MIEEMTEEEMMAQLKLSVIMLYKDAESGALFVSLEPFEFDKGPSDEEAAQVYTWHSPGLRLFEDAPGEVEEIDVRADFLIEEEEKQKQWYKDGDNVWDHMWPSFYYLDMDGGHDLEEQDFDKLEDFDKFLVTEALCRRQVDPHDC